MPLRASIPALCAVPLIAVAALGCASRRPVLYPNVRLQTVGSEVAESDISACLDAAQAFVDASPARDVATRTVTEGAVGGATGAAVGAVVGHPGRGAAAGAAGAATSGLLRGLLASRDPDPLVRSFTERCLRDLGYDPIGWR